MDCAQLAQRQGEGFLLLLACAEGHNTQAPAFRLQGNMREFGFLLCVERQIISHDDALALNVELAPFPHYMNNFTNMAYMINLTEPSKKALIIAA